MSPHSSGTHSGEAGPTASEPLRGTARSARTCVLLGASGLVGGHLLDRLRADPYYGRIIALARRPLGLGDPKVAEVLVDWDRPDTWDVGAEDVFCCLGTTIRQAGSQAAFRKVDFEYPTEIGRRAVAAGAGRYLLCSAIGADPNSRIFYNRVKGECERALGQLDFPRGLHVFRPSLLLGQRAKPRAGEAVAAALSQLVRPLLSGSLLRYRPIEAKQVAAAMHHAAKTPSAAGLVVYEGADLFRIADEMKP